MLTALSNPKVLAELAIVVVLLATNGGPLLTWALSKLGGVKMPSFSKAAAAGERTPGDVLDCLNAQMAYFRANTDAPADKLKAIEDLTPYLTHVKAVPVAPSAPQAPGASA
jgi:hypothetical protein